MSRIKAWCWIASVAMAATGLAGCCHVNRLAGRAASLKSVGLELGEDPQLSLLFTRKMTRQANKYMGLALRTSRAVLFYQDLLPEFGGTRLRLRLTERLPKVLERRFGWRPEAGGGLLQVQIEELVFTAADPETPLSLVWRLKAALRDERAGGELLWRDCLEWTQSAGALTMKQLEQMGPNGRERLLAEWVDGLAEYLARRLAADGLGR